MTWEQGKFSKLARRRHDRWRKVQRARWVHKHIYQTEAVWQTWSRNPNYVGRAPDPAKPQKDADNMALCSGLCCGNQRAYCGPTWRERRFDVSELNDYPASC
jgi:hypothetical protein